MLRLLISNQRGGAGKTTTATTMARILADRGHKVLVVDIDPQGSVSAILGLRPELTLYDFLIGDRIFEDCIVHAHANIDVLCHNRKTVEAEARLMATIGRERVFQNVFQTARRNYQVILMDSSPTITLLSTCATLYARQILVPVSMDVMSFQGTTANVQSAESLNRIFEANIKTVAILPVMVHGRRNLTDMVMKGLDRVSEEFKIPLLPGIHRTDTAVGKAASQKKFLVDYDPTSKALEDYVVATDDLLKLLAGQLDAETLQVGR